MKKNYTVILFLMFIISIFSTEVFPSTLGVIKGNVYDAETKKPLEKVKVTIISRRAESVQFKLFTDKEGYFYKSGLPIGVYIIEFEIKGYAPNSTTKRIGIAAKEKFTVMMAPVKNQTNESNRAVEQSVNLINSGDFSKAAQKLSDAIEKNPENFVLYYYRGYCYEKSKELDKALSDYHKSNNINPEFLLAIQGLGNIYAKKKEFTSAINFFQKAIEMGSTDIITYYNYGISLVNRGDSTAALMIFEKLLSIDPNYPDALYEAGILYLGLENSQKAKEYLQKFIELDPKNQKSIIAMQILDTLK